MRGPWVYLVLIALLIAVLAVGWALRERGRAVGEARDALAASQREAAKAAGLTEALAKTKEELQRLASEAGGPSVPLPPVIVTKVVTKEVPVTIPCSEPVAPSDEGGPPKEVPELELLVKSRADLIAYLDAKGRLYFSGKLFTTLRRSAPEFVREIEFPIESTEVSVSKELDEALQRASLPPKQRWFGWVCPALGAAYDGELRAAVTCAYGLRW